MHRQARTAAIAAVQMYLGMDADPVRISSLVDAQLQALDPMTPVAAGRDVVAA